MRKSLLAIIALSIGAALMMALLPTDPSAQVDEADSSASVTPVAKTADRAMKGDVAHRQGPIEWTEDPYSEASRAAALAQLKTQWRSLLGAKDPDPAALKALAQASLKKLLFYPELYELLKYLHQLGEGSNLGDLGSTSIRENYRIILQGEEATAAMESILSWAGIDQGQEGWEGKWVGVREFSDALASYASEKMVFDFIERVESISPWCAQEAKGAYAKRIVMDDPVGAVRMLVDAVIERAPVGSLRISAGHLLGRSGAMNWSGVDFSSLMDEVEAANDILSRDPSRRLSNPFPYIRDDLYNRWIFREPDAAIDSALREVGEVRDSVFQGFGDKIARSANQERFEKTMEAVPSGPLRDQYLWSAAHAANILGVGFTQKMAEQIENPRLREEATHKIQGFRSLIGDPRAAIRIRE